MHIWICIPVFNRIEFTLQCLATLKAQIFHDFTVIVCDHGSTDGTSTEIHQQFPDVVVISAENSLWWTGAMNLCVRYVLEHATESDTLLTLNNDTELPPDYLQQLVSCSERFQDSIITSVIHDIKTGAPHEIGYRQNWFLATSRPVNFENHHVINNSDVIEITHASGRGTLFPIAVFRKIGLFDEKRLPHYAADYDFSFRAVRAGFKIYVSRHSRVLSYVEETGLYKVLSNFSINGFLDYFTGMRSPANLKSRFWLGWNNCPKKILPLYMTIDFVRITGSYFKHFVIRN
ncbi:glycosyltransferase family 2 protein [Methylomicrobium lacus]|uniref:glycosyltransferase family 2 protein n=1 Tax=Methylomicrobium lacus TaxID=136992 RepID=UPI0035A972F6